jgi:hypothetical protein
LFSSQTNLLLQGSAATAAVSDGQALISASQRIPEIQKIVSFEIAGSSASQKSE